MKYILYGVVILILYVAFVYGRILYISSHNKNPAILQTGFREGFGPTLKYIAAGDSTAVGVGASAVEKTYTYKVAERLSKTYSVEYKNVGVIGAKTGDVLNNQLSQIINFNPDVVTVSIGANDATHLIGAGTIKEHYTEILSRLTKETHAKVYITDIPNFYGASLLPNWYIQFLEYRTSKINPELLKMETDRVKFVNIHDFGWNQYPDRSVTYSFDYFHPSNVGYENWTNAFLDKISK